MNRNIKSKDSFGFDTLVVGERICKKTGKVLSRFSKHNLIVNSGLERIAKLLNGVSTAPFTKLAIGTDATAPTNTDTELGNQVDILTATLNYEVSNKATWEATFTFESGQTITEAGIFTADGVTMLDRLIFDTQNVGSDVDFHIKITIETKRTV